MTTAMMEKNGHPVQPEKTASDAPKRAEEFLGDRSIAERAIERIVKPEDKK